jgi:hypothetical protein
MSQSIHDAAAGHEGGAGLGATELRLLIRLQRADFAAVERSLDGHPEQVNGLADACARSGLAVVLARALEGSPFRPLLTPERRRLLEERQHRQRDRQQALEQALGHIADRFHAAGQRFLLLKGIYLGQRFYGDPGGREFMDLDLLVPRADRPRAGALLDELGFVRRSQVLMSSRLTRWFVHAFDYRGHGANVDLHWALSRHPSLRLDEARIWSRTASFAIDGRSFGVLGDSDEVLFAVLSLLRDLERGRPKAKNVVDLIQIVASTDATLDWETLLTAGDGSRGPLVNVLGACLDLCLAHDFAPRLSVALSRHGGRRIEALPTGAPLHYWPSTLALGNKLWAAGAYDSSLPAWLAWWALSLPFRLAVHRPPRHTDEPRM